MARAPFTPAWQAGSPQAVALLPPAFAERAARTAAVSRAAQRRADPTVVQSIHVTTDAQRANRDALAQLGTACVVTGQQAGLFGGPLYTVYKAAAAIVNAQALEAETGTRCVPVFWLQNEDHDFAEIARSQVLASDDALVNVAVDDDPALGLRSVGARPLGLSVEGALATLQDAIEGLPEAASTMEQLRRHYTPEASPDQAFRGLIESLFAEHGLLVIDPRAPGLQAAAASVHRQGFAAADAISQVLGTRSEALEAAGFAVQVYVRPGSPLSFVHPDGVDGPRFRLEPCDDPAQWGVCGTSRTVSRADAASWPCSTSALLRPILQDSWLPTAAYVGGPGEIAYFAQLPPLYAHFGIPMPLVVPRARFRIVDPVSARLLSQLGIRPEQLALPVISFSRR